MGSSYEDSTGAIRRVGSNVYSDLTTFSFHPVKNITTGEGGAITTNDDEVYHLLKRYRSHGNTKVPEEVKYKDLAFTEINGKLEYNPWYYEMHQLANNYRISDFQCALGLSQLKKLDGFVKRRNELASLYHKAIEEICPDKISPLHQREGIINAYHLFVVRIPMKSLKGDRAGLMYRLRDQGINTQVHYIPMYKQPYYREYIGKEISLENTEDYYDECLSLPLFPALNNDHPFMIVKAIKTIIDELWTEG